MSTAPAASFSTPTIDQVSALPTSARPESDNSDFIPTYIDSNGETQIKARYSHLSRNRKEYILAADKNGLYESAMRIANCFTHGAVFCRCPEGSNALGNKFSCGEHFCPVCGKGKSKLHAWMAQRDPDRIFAEAQVGIELDMPVKGHLSAHAWQLNRDRLYKLAKQLVTFIGPGLSTVMRDGAPYIDSVSLRMGIRIGHLACAEVKAKWQELAGPRAGIRFQHQNGATGRQAKSLLEWVFSSMERSLDWSAANQVFMRQAMAHIHMVRTTGNYYRPMAPEVVQERHEEQRKIPRYCHCAKCEGKRLMQYIPIEHRIVEPCNEIEAEYHGNVGWCSEFPEPQLRVVCIPPIQTSRAGERAGP